MKSAVTFARRIAKREDLPEIVDIYNSTIPSHLVTADIEPVSVQSRVCWFDEHSADFRPLWVVEIDGHVAGWLSFSSFYRRPAYHKTAEISVYVQEAHRKQRLGSYFLAEALAYAPSLKVDTLMGFIFGHNMPSLVLFEKFAFERWGVLPKVAALDGVERDLIIVGRRV